tara:strand:- start:963 stop:1442 length:480 start_codon:yes stop_codon:yes gene_type:complete
MSIKAKVIEKISYVNRYKFSILPVRHYGDINVANSLIGSYFLVSSGKGFKLAQKCGNNGEYNIITHSTTLKALSSILDILNNCLLENQRRMREEINSVKFKHEQEIDQKVDQLLEEKHSKLLRQVKEYKEKYKTADQKLHELRNARNNMKAYVKKHFKL